MGAAFHYGFNRYHFERNPAAGAAALLEAVPRAQDQQDRWALENLAAKWIERGYRSAEAARLVEGMARVLRPVAFVVTWKCAPNGCVTLMS
ncbi:MAG: hypothetical protein IPH39_21270 [Sulfuritalea sp.]|nr:hypothetical protein [Sulfuritalea sp.]